jgi:hypothetical protein
MCNGNGWPNIITRFLENDSKIIPAGIVTNHDKNLNVLEHLTCYLQNTSRESHRSKVALNLAVAALNIWILKIVCLSKMICTLSAIDNCLVGNF